MRITIGTPQRDYATVRNILSPVPDVDQIRTRNVFRYPNYLLFKGFDRIDPFLANLHWGARDCDLLHFFNMLSLGKTPWVTTFETALPRWQETHPGAIGLGLKLLAGKSCKRLIAMSECARAFQGAVLADYPDVAEAIQAKVTVLHPPQSPLIDGAKPGPSTSEPIRFAIVGADFFRKGGGEVLRVFDRLLREGAAIRLTIVSTLQHGDYATRTTAADLAEARRMIAAWPGRIVHFERLPNDQVLELFRSSHIALLPTWADTYGYSVLEAQAAGCPVLTTDVRALPEINDDVHGWVLPVPRNDRGNAVIGTPAERERFAQMLEGQIEAAIRSVLADPAMIAAKGAASLARIKARHSPVTYGLRLREIYDEALADR